MGSNDPTTVRIVVGALGLIVVATLTAEVILTLAGYQLVHDAWLLATTALGGLIGFFVSARTGGGDTVPVEVQQPTGSPVPTTEVTPRRSR